ncbi:MAG: RsmB/NOP family class I SAM-dependent RNA methyltransferase [Lentisphaeria bacterium]|nr:RsmB/NOP family class I SAM-dependent RNA methyltransferase [Lentisphaeria bacterium]
MTDRPLKSNWIRTRADRSEELLARTMKAVFTDHHPADQFLKSVFRADHRIGGRDRRLYSELIFAVFRWYGFLRQTADPALLLAGAAAAEGLRDPAVSCFLQDAGLDADRTEELFEAENPFDRLDAFRRLAGMPGGAAEADCIPKWIIPHLDFDPDAEFYRSWQTRPPLWLRVQRGDPAEICDMLRESGLTVRPHGRLGTALKISDARVNLSGLEAARQGRVEVQDLSSQCIGQVCAPKAGEFWWDACAGGGGKTLQLASLMDGKGTVLASDVREKKLDEVKRRAGLAGAADIRTAAWDGTTLPVAPGSCDGVLVDAPCSSSGRWRRNPESRWVLTPERVAELAGLQRQILGRAADAVKPGGALVYATCSFLRDENRLTVEAFLAAHPDFKPEPFVHPLTGGMVPGRLQILPEDGDCDASFIARFRKEA